MKQKCLEYWFLKKITSKKDNPDVEHFWIMQRISEDQIIPIKLMLPVSDYTYRFRKTSIPNLHIVLGMPYVTGPLSFFNRNNNISFNIDILSFYDRETVLNLYLCGLITKDLLFDYILEHYKFSREFKTLLFKRDFKLVVDTFLSCIKIDNWDLSGMRYNIAKKFLCCKNPSDFSVLKQLINSDKDDNFNLRLRRDSPMFIQIPRLLLVLEKQNFFLYFKSLFNPQMEHDSSYLNIFNRVTTKNFEIQFANYICEHTFLDTDYLNIKNEIGIIVCTVASLRNLIQICVGFADTDKLELFLQESNLDLKDIMINGFCYYGKFRMIYLSTIHYSTYLKYGTEEEDDEKDENNKKNKPICYPSVKGFEQCTTSHILKFDLSNAIQFVKLEEFKLFYSIYSKEILEILRQKCEQIKDSNHSEYSLFFEVCHRTIRRKNLLYIFQLLDIKLNYDTWFKPSDNMFGEIKRKLRALLS